MFSPEYFEEKDDKKIFHWEDIFKIDDNEIQMDLKLEDPKKKKKITIKEIEIHDGKRRKNRNPKK